MVHLVRAMLAARSAGADFVPVHLVAVVTIQAPRLHSGGSVRFDPCFAVASSAFVRVEAARLPRRIRLRPATHHFIIILALLQL